MTDFSSFDMYTQGMLIFLGSYIEQLVMGGDTKHDCLYPTVVKFLVRLYMEEHEQNDRCSATRW